MTLNVAHFAMLRGCCCRNKITSSISIIDSSVPCCLGDVPAVPSPPAYEWPNPSKEEDPRNVESVSPCVHV